MRRPLSLILGIVLCVAMGGIPTITHAGTLSAVSMSLSSSKTNTTNVTHDFSFTTTTTETLETIVIRYSTTQGGSTKPAGLDLSNGSPGGVTGISGTWDYDVTQASSGILTLTEQGGGVSVSASTAITISLDAVTNSAMDDCQPGNNGLQDVCHVRITTYNDSDALVDSGDTTYLLTEDPILTFQVEAVASSVTHNGITTTRASEVSAINFGKVPQLTRHVLRHKITVTTNAPGGYTVTAHFHDAFAASTNDTVTIQPFGAVDATWLNPQTWSSPDGVDEGEDTAWLGANTTDTRVSGWSGNTSNKFSPFGTTTRPVAYASGPDRSGTAVYVSYALELNGGQPADLYEGLIVYDVQASY